MRKLIKTALFTAFLVFVAPILAGMAHAWSVSEAQRQANQTLMVVGDWCSGTIVDRDNGLVATAAHCTEPVHVRVDNVHKPSGQVIAHKVDRYDPVDVTLFKFNPTGEEIGHITYSMKVLKAVYPADVAILQNVSAEKFTGEVRLSITPPKYGDKVYTVGNPRMFLQTIAEGHVTKPKYKLVLGADSVEAIVIDSYMGPGSSGGGLFNDHGDLIGITNWGLSGGPYLASPVINVITLLNELGFGKNDKMASAQ